MRELIKGNQNVPDEGAHQGQSERERTCGSRLELPERVRAQERASLIEVDVAARQEQVEPRRRVHLMREAISMQSSDALSRSSHGGVLT